MTQLTLSLPPETAARIAEEAAARGITPEAVATEAVEAWMAVDDLDWEEDERRLNEPGENVRADVVFAELRAEVERLRKGAA